MAESAESEEIFWVDPRFRGILPLDGFHISRSLARTLRQQDYEVTLDRDFEGVLRGCADREETWINPRIFSLYLALHRMGHAHSIEVWQCGQLAGGVYGVTLGGAFFGESMFSRIPSASKIALAYLTDHLARCGFTLFDTQFITPHLATMGGVEIPRADYHDLLQDALQHEGDFLKETTLPPPQDILQRSTQTS
ncbi:leucyl/phenylalanyl-tRNA--protein transferase [Pseudoruegeria sp. HB172150]|uniref:leucyl/phenylalanyl-tRNA--protein transferase n=1 Tax=Pseudoruegeria sp. HB172150 TaxID=2721164 RepID=UPI0020A698B4